MGVALINSGCAARLVCLLSLVLFRKMPSPKVVLLASERSERYTLRSVQSRIADIYIYYWRASEGSETLSGLFNRESWLLLL